MCVCVCVCVSVGDRRREEKECGRMRLSISVGVCMFLHAGTHVLWVILCEMWRAGRAGQTVQRKGQLCNYTRGSGDKWQGCQLNNQYSRSMASVIEVKKRKLKTKSSHENIFSLLSPPHSTSFSFLLSSFSQDTWTKATIWRCGFIQQIEF